MRQISTLFILFFLVSSSMVWGQRSSVRLDETRSTLQFNQALEGESRMEKDTIFFPTALTDCGLSGFAYGVDPWGFTSGTNAFGDLAVSQLVRHPDPDASLELEEVFISLSTASVVGDGELVAIVYSVANDSGPLDLLATSMPVKVSEVGIEPGFAIFTPFQFENPVPIPDGNEIHVGLDFSRVYASNDTVNVFTTDTCANGNNTWTQFNEDGSLVWAPFTSLWGLNVDLFIGASVTVLDPTAVNDPVEISGIRLESLFPNPAKDQIRLSYELESTEQLSIEVFSIDGKRVLQHQLGRQSPGRHTEMLDISALSTGSYRLLLSNGKRSLTTGFTVKP